MADLLAKKFGRQLLVRQSGLLTVAGVLPSASAAATRAQPSADVAAAELYRSIEAAH